MKSKSIRLALASAILTALAAVGGAQAADIIPVNFDGPNEGYNDTTPVAPVGGNPGTTRGQQRLIVAEYAAALWGSVLKSDVPIYVGAQFNPLPPNVLGSAGATNVYSATGGTFPYDNIWYNVALAEALYGGNINGNNIDINSQFSSDFAFYYGLDGKTPAGLVNFLDVIMHEYAHGLGFQNFENEGTGYWLGGDAGHPEAGHPDIYSVFTYDNTAGKFWTQMNSVQRKASAINTGNVVFTGARAVAGAQMLLDKRLYFRVTAPAAIKADYAYGVASFGPAAAPANFSGKVVLGTDGVGTTGDGCEPITSPVNGKVALIDRGSCSFNVKVKNAQDAGATAVIIADNAPGPVLGMSGTDATITIPAIRITQADGNLFKANLPVKVKFVQDPVLLQGADDLGRPRLYMPNPVQSGSSGSHYDSVAMPNLLMEPAINDSLRSYYNLDITPALLADIGWELNTGNSKMGSPNTLDCDTGIPAVNDSGLMAGSTVQATHEMCLVSATTRPQYSTCMTEGKDRLVNAGLLTVRQGQSVMVCARRITDHTRFPIPQ